MERAFLLMVSIYGIRTPYIKFSTTSPADDVERRSTAMQARRVRRYASSNSPGAPYKSKPYDIVCRKPLFFPLVIRYNHTIV